MYYGSHLNTNVMKGKRYPLKLISNYNEVSYKVLKIPFVFKVEKTPSKVNLMTKTSFERSVVFVMFRLILYNFTVKEGLVSQMKSLSLLWSNGFHV